jgi:hypothetical protein
VLGEDDRRSVFEKSPLSRHFTTREEKLFKIGVVRFEHLATLLSQGVEGGSRMLPMLRLDSLCLNFPPFMLDVLEVVDSPAELLKCVATRIEHEPEAPDRNSRNRTTWFLELDSPVLSRPAAVRGTAGLR